MKIVQLNATCGRGSTGKICVSISKLMCEKGIENHIIYSLGKSEYHLGIKFSNKIYGKVQALKSRILGNYGFNSHLSTINIIRIIDKINPNIVHIHNIHTHDFNLNMLFKYLQREKIKIFWTFHDCWAFTGYCTHFTMTKCGRWRTGCHNCPQFRKFSWFKDKSSELYERKKAAVEGLDLIIVTPSQWLADLVKQSFFKEYPIKVINNGINLSIFKPCESDFRTKYHLENKYIILGVAYIWEQGKGIDVFIELSKRLDQSKYQLVLIGNLDKDKRKYLKNVIFISRTNNQQELARIYSAADVFVNPTREENYPTVNMEALACGTPVVTFQTGGSPEILDETCGLVIPVDDLDAFEQAICHVCEEHLFTKAACLLRGTEFDQMKCFQKYIDLYEEILR